MKLTLTKTRNYDLEPFGNFTFKWNKPKVDKPNVIYIGELQIFHDAAMPLSVEQDKELVKQMKKYKTDVFKQGHEYFTRKNTDLVPIRHKKLFEYEIVLGDLNK